MKMTRTVHWERNLPIPLPSIPVSPHFRASTVAGPSIPSSLQVVSFCMSVSKSPTYLQTLEFNPESKSLSRSPPPIDLINRLMSVLQSLTRINEIRAAESYRTILTGYEREWKMYALLVSKCIAYLFHLSQGRV